MVQREIQIFMKIPDISQPFGIYTSSYDAGRVGDSGATMLKFNRPQEYENNNLRILIQPGDSFDDRDSSSVIDIGQNNELLLTQNFTMSTSFILQIGFTESNGNLITLSNKLTFYLTSSLINPNSIPDYLQELLQFAISDKTNKMTVVKEVDPSDQTKTIYKLIAFNHFGSKIVDIELPVNSVVESSAINYDNSQVSDNPITSSSVQGAIDELVEKLKNTDPDADLILF